MSTVSDLGRRVRTRLGELARPPGGDAPILVALSGGLDSCVLLHLLRFGAQPTPRLAAVHFDHAMRDGSASDADWVRGVCRAWGVPVYVERAGRPPVSEDEARTARYAFVERVRLDTGATVVATAHHADDQAETVLFRVLRGTGLSGLRGIPARREPDVVRPLLGVWREELEAYAVAHRIRWREDETNDHLGYARNLLRHQILPAVERGVCTGARRSLVRLGEIATADEEAWEEVMRGLLVQLDIAEAKESEAVSDTDSDAGSGAVGGTTGRRVVSVDREALAGLGPALRARVLRALADRVGWTLDHGTTERAVAFAAGGPGGKLIELGGGAELRRRGTRVVMAGPVEGLRRVRPVGAARRVPAGSTRG